MSFQSSNDSISGSSFNDSISGSSYNDSLSGSSYNRSTSISTVNDSFSGSSFNRSTSNTVSNRSVSAWHTNQVLFIVIITMLVGGLIVIAYLIYRCAIAYINRGVAPVGTTALYTMVPDSQMRGSTVERFLEEIAAEKPIRFTPQQLSCFTNDYSTRLGSGGFGTVYKGVLPNGLAVAVKRLHAGHDDRASQEQFMAEVGAMARTQHINLVRLFGFCFDDAVAVRALVFEYMDNGALDAYLFERSHGVDFPTLHAIAVGVARGLRYLHEECQRKIVHYDIKPGNVLLDGSLTPKVADFGLARLLSRADTHESVAGHRGTPGYIAPEMCMGPARVTEKCDTYSFGKLLFEIVGRRRNFDEGLPESRQYFPELVWQRYESGRLMEVLDSVDEQDRETIRRMCKVALWCVQPAPEARPTMGTAVMMLEGRMDIDPPPNPFIHVSLAAPAANNLWSSSSGGSTVSASTLRDTDQI